MGPGPQNQNLTGIRPGRSAHDALDAIREQLYRGKREVYDADLKGYFDTIPHDQLTAALSARISDRSVLKLIRMWLQTPVEETDENGRKSRHRPTAGTPQGGAISPLLANLYLHWFEVLFYRSDGPAHWAKATLIRYADDFVLLAYYQGEAACADVRNAFGPPDAGNPHVRWDEGGGTLRCSSSTRLFNRSHAVLTPMHRRHSSIVTFARAFPVC